MKIRCSHTRTVDPKTLEPNPGNTRRHPDFQIDVLIRIIAGNGWRNPIVVSNRSGFVTKGHGRLQAALKAGWSEVPVDDQDYESEAHELADVIADNRIQEFNETDQDKLRAIIEQIRNAGGDIELTGYDKVAINAMFDSARVALNLAMQNQANQEDGDQIRQIMLIYEDAEFPAITTAMKAELAKRQSESPSVTVLQMLREYAKSHS